MPALCTERNAKRSSDWGLAASCRFIQAHRTTGGTERSGTSSSHHNWRKFREKNHNIMAQSTYKALLRVPRHVTSVFPKAITHHTRPLAHLIHIISLPVWPINSILSHWPINPDPSVWPINSILSHWPINPDPSLGLGSITTLLS